MQLLKTVSGSQHLRLLHIIIYLSVILFSACSTTADKVDRLEQSLRAYETAMRWAQFDTVYSFHKWDTSELPTVPTYLKSIRVTNYNVANRTFDENTMTAKQIVIIKFYNQNDARERTLEDRQSWKYFPDLNRWYLTSMPPEFK